MRQFSIIFLLVFSFLCNIIGIGVTADGFVRGAPAPTVASGLGLATFGVLVLILTLWFNDDQPIFPTSKRSEP